MTDESFPLEIEGHRYELRFDDTDVRKGSGGVEATLSLFVAFHPINMTYDNAALFLFHGLRKRGQDGKLVYIFQQDSKDLNPAIEMVKKFCRQFPGPMGMAVLYGSIDKALIASGWYGNPEEKAAETAAQSPATEGGEPGKN